MDVVLESEKESGLVGAKDSPPRFTDIDCLLSRSGAFNRRDTEYGVYLSILDDLALRLWGFRESFLHIDLRWLPEI